VSSFRYAAGVAALLAVTLAGCASAPRLDAKELSVSEAEGKQGACETALDRENPFIVEWPGTHKVELESISKRGLVAVRLQGCKLEVLPRCEAAGSYSYESVTPSRDKLEIKDDADLFSKLPISSQALQAELASGRSLTLDYVLVGQKLAAAPPSELSGDCATATHYVRTISIGAYNMESAAKAKSGASIDVGIVQAGGSSDSSRQRLKNSGDLEACSSKTELDEKAVKSSGCGAPVRLGLAPLP
jgi:hypothetical protein